MRKNFATFAYIFGIVVVLSFWGLALSFLLPYSYKDFVKYYASTYNLDPNLVCAIINTESHFNPSAKSSAGALGLMQLMPTTAEELATQLGLEQVDLFDAETNIHLGCFYLNKLLNEYKTLETALCAYNAGPGNTNRWLNDTNYSQNGQTLSFIPFEETRNYVRKVGIFRTFYTKIYNH